MSYEIIKNYRHNEQLRKSFNELSQKTFGGLEFETWYQNGYWNEKYIPYSILQDGKIISNVSVNRIDCTLNGTPKHYIQLGTVMTDENHRNKGYARILMEEVQKDFSGCDGFYLYANDSVLDFYPKFGFEKAEEYRFSASIDSKSDNTTIPILMTNQQEWQDFLKEKNQRKSQGFLTMDTDDLMMFYLTQFMQKNVYYIKEKDAYVIAEADGDTLTLYDIFSAENIDILSLCFCFGKDIQKVEFAFTPRNYSEFEKSLYKEEDTTFFVLGETIKKDIKQFFAFPQLTHA